MFLGETGFSLFINLLQYLLFMFALWSTFIFSKEIFNIYKEASGFIVILTIVLFIAYFIAFAYLISISIRWYTIIASIETKRNEKCLKKAINYQMHQYAEISNSIAYAFKKIYYDNIYELDENDNPFKLSITNFQKKLNFYVMRFKRLIGQKKKDTEEEQIDFDIKTELTQFLKSCGMELNEEELDFMLHISGDKKSLELGKLKHKQLDDVWAGINYFCSRNTHEIVRDVFYHYYSRDGMENLDKQSLYSFSYNKISDFLVFYKEYFDDNLVKFMLEEVSYLGRNFNVDAFIFRILGYGCLNTF